MLAPERARGQCHNLGPPLAQRPFPVLHLTPGCVHHVFAPVSMMSPGWKVPGVKAAATLQQPSPGTADHQQLSFEGKVGKRVQGITLPTPVPPTIPRRSPPWTVVAGRSRKEYTRPNDSATLGLDAQCPCRRPRRHPPLPAALASARADPAPVPSAPASGRGAPVAALRAPPAGRSTAGLGQDACPPVRGEPLEPRTAGPPPLGLDAVSRRRHPRSPLLARALSGSSLDRENGTPRASRVFWKKLLRAQSPRFSRGSTLAQRPLRPWPGRPAPAPHPPRPGPRAVPPARSSAAGSRTPSSSASSSPRPAPA